MFRTLWWILQPSIDALTAPGIPFTYRWRLLLLQPVTFLTYTLIGIPYIFSSPFTTIYIPNRHGYKLRTLVYVPKRRKSDQFSPLHISFHAGGFIGGFPESQLKFNELLAERTGAVVVAPHYRVAPRYPFPAAIDDTDDLVAFCIENAERLWGADPKLLTLDGFSAGGNLALALCQQEACHAPAETAVKASVTFYAPVGGMAKMAYFPRLQMLMESSRWIFALRPWKSLDQRTFPRRIRWRS
jgi:acetyl esterase/lipase